MVIVLLIVLAGGAAGFLYWKSHGPPSDRLLLYGNVDIRQVDLSFDNEGRISQMLVEEGDRVETGQLLATLDPSRFEDAVNAAEGQLAQQRQVVAKLERGIDITPPVVAVLFGAAALFLLAALGMGLLISSLVRTQQQAILGAFLFLVPAVILSGFATPIANMPPLVQHLTWLNPMRYFLVIVRGLFLRGMSFDLILHHLWPLALIAMATLSLATWLFRHHLE